MQDLAGLELELRRSVLRDSLVDFMEWAWPRVTGMPLVWNDALRALVAALQDVADGKVTRLLVAIAPGTGKTTTLDVYSAWCLARRADWRTIRASHSYEIAATASRRVRRLVDSDDFRRLFPEVALRSDENTINAWHTTRDGAIYSVGTGGALTGRRAHAALLDDPMNAPDRFSKAAREALWAWFCESLSTRLDGERAPIIVVQQRLDRDDLIGRLLAQTGWTVLELPAEREDRTLLAPNVLSREKLDALKLQIGATAYTTQYLQRPTDDSTAIIRRSWWRFYRPAHVSEHAPRPAGCDVDTPAVAMPSSFERVVIAADLTFGSVTGDYNAVQVWGSRGGGRYLIEAHRSRAGFEMQLEVLEALALRYPGCAVLVEKAANGAAVIETLRARIAGVIALKPRGSKQARLGAAAPAVESGSCYLPLGWNGLPEYVEELSGATKYDDQADATAYAVTELATRAVHNVDVDLALGGEIASVETNSGSSDVLGGIRGEIHVARRDYDIDLSLGGRR